MRLFINGRSIAPSAKLAASASPTGLAVLNALLTFHPETARRCRDARLALKRPRMRLGYCVSLK